MAEIIKLTKKKIERLNEFKLNFGLLKDCGFSRSKNCEVYTPRNELITQILNYDNLFKLENYFNSIRFNGDRIPQHLFEKIDLTTQNFDETSISNFPKKTQVLVPVNYMSSNEKHLKNKKIIISNGIEDLLVKYLTTAKLQQSSFKAHGFTFSDFEIKINNDNANDFYKLSFESKENFFLSLFRKKSSKPQIIDIYLSIKTSFYRLKNLEKL